MLLSPFFFLTIMKQGASKTHSLSSSQVPKLLVALFSFLCSRFLSLSLFLFCLFVCFSVVLLCLFLFCFVLFIIMLSCFVCPYIVLFVPILFCFPIHKPRLKDLQLTG